MFLVQSLVMMEAGIEIRQGRWKHWKFSDAVRRQGIIKILRASQNFWSITGCVLYCAASQLRTRQDSAIGLEHRTICLRWGFTSTKPAEPRSATYSAKIATL